MSEGMSDEQRAASGYRSEAESAEVIAGKRCYDCGNLFEDPARAEKAETVAEWVAANPSHGHCFE